MPDDHQQRRTLHAVPLVCSRRPRRGAPRTALGRDPSARHIVTAIQPDAIPARSAECRYRAATPTVVTVSAAKGAIAMDFSDILGAIIVGAVVGVLGRLALPGKQRIGAFVTLLIGVGAAFLGTYLADRFGLGDKAPQKLWFLAWDWLVLGIQVGLAAVGTALAALVAHSRLSADGTPKKAPARKPATRKAKADA
jgi:uncharacterized membrane protein YeaQ/YmgE (transglycosylase-associated protein family)